MGKTETTVSINISMKDFDLKQADAMMRKMIKALSYEEIEAIKEAKVSKTMAEIEMSSNIFDSDEKGGI